LLRGEGTKVEESNQAFVGNEEVGNISDETLLGEEVKEVVGSGLPTALENIQAEAEKLIEIKDISDMNYGTLNDEEVKEVVTILAIDPTDTKSSD
jgi:hypothetical protein